MGESDGSFFSGEDQEKDAEGTTVTEEEGKSSDGRIGEYLGKLFDGAPKSDQDISDLISEGLQFFEKLGVVGPAEDDKREGVCEHEMLMTRTKAASNALVIAALNDITSPTGDPASDRQIFECVAIIRTLRALNPHSHFHFH